MIKDSAREARLVVADNDAGTRLDLFLTARLPEFSRSRIQQLIKAGQVTIDGARTKASLLTTSGLEIVVGIPHPTPAGVEAEPMPLHVIYEDEDIVVIDKPAGIVVHPGAGHRTGTLVNALLHHVGGLSGIGGEERPGIVHRLDKGTSGVMVVAKHDRAHRSLARQFHDHRVTKEYIALVWGEPSVGVIERPIGRDPRDRKKMSSRARHARAATTRIVSSKPLGGVSLLHLTIGTGRTHQIRVHLSEAGHPIVGDVTYGGVRRHVPARLSHLAHVTRPLLHAHRLTFTHPTTGQEVSFVAGDVSVFHSFVADGDRPRQGE